MASPPLFSSRSLKLRYWNVEARAVDAERLAVETHLRRLGDLRVEAVPRLDAEGVFPCDLLVVGANRVPEPDFAVWLRGFRARLQASHSIWTPALILADVSFDVLREILPEAAQDNWYFDIVAPQHLSSLPIRVANLLRIHDHLHEVRRYAEALDEVNGRVQDLEAQVQGLNTSRRVTTGS